MLFVAGSILMINSFFSSRSVLSHEVNALAEVTSLAITPSLIFDQRKDAQQTLETLHAHNNIIYAAVLKTEEQQVFALYQRTPELQLPRAGLLDFEKCLDYAFSLTSLTVCKPLVFDNITYGTIVIALSLNDVYQRSFTELGIALLGLILASGLIFLILDKFIQKLTVPVLELLAISEQVSKSGKYDLRATILSSDEIGRLGQAFNIMLEKIQIWNDILTKQKEALEELVKERTHEKNKALVLADQAQKASIAKSDFLSVMSHEIRTPLNAILGFSDLLKETGLSQQQREYINIINHSGSSLLTQINDILDFSKIESGKMELDWVWFDIYELLSAVLASNRYASSQKSLQLKHQIAPGLPRYLYGDKQKIKQILYNLLNNAIKFTEDGFVSLTGKYHLIDKDECVITFAIKDTGLGMTEAEQARIFEPFSQADSSTTRKYGGTGLGLAIVKRLVTLQKGQFSYRSTKGLGTEFIIDIPLKLTAPDTEKEQLKRPLIALFEEGTYSVCAMQLKRLGYDIDLIDQATSHHLQQKPEQAYKYQLLLFSQDCFEQILYWQEWNVHNKKKMSLASYCSNAIQNETVFPSISDMEVINISNDGLDIVEQINRIASTSVSVDSLENTDEDVRILVVEDNYVNLLMTQNILKQIGLKSQAARNGKQAVELTETGQYSLILMDCQMPIMDGFAATRAIRNREKETAQHIPIIALTANAFKEDREACVAAGMDAYLSKPFKKQQMIDVLDYWLKKVKNASSGEQLRDSVLDPVLIQELLDMDGQNSKKFIREISESFFTNAEQLMSAIELAFSENTIETIEKAAHQLKSSSLNVAAKELSNLFRQLELTAKQSDYQRTEKIWKYIIQEYHLVEQAYVKFLQE